MAADLQEDVTTLLDRIRAGDTTARDRLVERLYPELHQMAVGFMLQERRDHTLQPTALLHEALLQLLDGAVLEKASNRRYLFAAVARAMRQVLVDHARQRATDKRGAGCGRVPLDEALRPFEEQHLDVLAVHEALEQLAQLNERHAQIMELRFFGGLTVPEVAKLLNVSVSLVEKDFRRASAFLRSRLA